MRAGTVLTTFERDRPVFKRDGVTWINWTTAGPMAVFGAETLESAKQTARISVTYACRRAGQVPAEIQRLVNGPWDKII